MNAFNVVVRMFLAGMLIAVAGPATAQQAYPTKSIRIIVAFPPGGAYDILARLFGQKLSESWGQPVIVDNRPGGNTIIATEALVKSPPDGYTVMLMSVTHAIIPSLLPLPFDAVKDFAPVATVSSTRIILMLHPAVAANNLQEFIALAKSRPGQLNFAAVGSGGSGHLAGELLKIAAGISMQYIPYKGGAPAVTDLISGQVQLSFLGLINVVPHLKSGRLKAIATTGETRSSVLPQVPTFAEAGLPGFDVNTWQGILAPAGTPKEVIAKLSTEIAKILATPDVMEKLASQGAEPFFSTPEQFAALMKADMVKYARVIKTANIKPDR